MEIKMFCENCGTKLEPGDLFCPECGTRVSEPVEPESQFTPGQQAAPLATPTPQPAPAAPAQESAPAVAPAPSVYTQANNVDWQVPGKKRGVMNVVLTILGALMFAWSFLPFIDIDLGKIGQLASLFGGPDLSNIKYNLYQIRDGVAGLADMDGGEQAKTASTIITVIVIFVVVVAILAIVSGIINNKGLLLASGIMSAVCLIMWIVYMVTVAQYKGMIIDELSYELGINVGGMIPSIHGIGLYLMMGTLAVHSILAIGKGAKL